MSNSQEIGTLPCGQLRDQAAAGSFSAPSPSQVSTLPESLVPIEMLLATVAKVLCSAVFVSGREPAEAFRHSALWALKAQLLPDALSRLVQWRNAKRKTPLPTSRVLE